MSLHDLIRAETVAMMSRSTTVEDLVDLLPEGVRALVDPLGPRAFVLDTEAVRAADAGGVE
ncbi:hypothetical protein SBI_09211 [Streptomyces bingchenggensis BCW-1]|uniref:Uncharacterized protein n=1 Tax=Streptomyces bingchenggensis (strain BCW-1) TaxID=749414 RepID=D7C3W3_STRBB|nr:MULTISPECIES: hypothetical protein [Streptomyces]ADI12329.1 hypothetical protein SBI_09211 [Streptomyces bingchenggensis BCW-1]